MHPRQRTQHLTVVVRPLTLRRSVAASTRIVAVVDVSRAGVDKTIRGEEPVEILLDEREDGGVS